MPTDNIYDYTGARNYQTYAGNMNTDRGEKHGIGILYHGSSTFCGSFTKDTASNGVLEQYDRSRGIYIKKSNSNSGQVDVWILNNRMIVDHVYNLYFFTNGDLYNGKSFGNMYTLATKFFANGDVYHGEFIDSLFEGGGTYLMANGGMYYGEYKKGVKHGKGYEIDINGKMKNLVYEYGVLKESKIGSANEQDRAKGRYGEIIFPSGHKYRGQLDNGEMGGFGMLELSTGDFCYGRFSKNDETKMKLVGIIKQKDGTIIYGYFYMPRNNTENDKSIIRSDPALRCRIRYPNGDFYIGKVSNSLSKHGLGAYYNHNGEIYIGEFKNDQRNGSGGFIIYQNKDILKSTFIDDKPDGSGEYIDAAKKEKYSGNFKNGLRDGKGIIFSADGTSKDVIYKNGVLQQ